MAPSSRRKPRAEAPAPPAAGTGGCTQSIRTRTILPPTPVANPHAGGTQMLTQTLSSRAVYRGNVHEVSGFMTTRECGAWLRWAEARGFCEAANAATREVAYRDCGRIEFWDEAVAGAIWDRLRGLVDVELRGGWVAVGCFAKIRVYRYCAGGMQRFGKHVDESCDVGEGEGGRRTGVTVLVYLNGAGEGGGDEGEEERLEGGETVFYRGNYGEKVAVAVVPREGLLLWHGHGEQCLVHEALGVRKGAKYVLRSDVVYERRK